MARLADTRLHFDLEPAGSRVCVLVPSAQREESACAGLSAATASSDAVVAIARVRHDKWSYATSVARDCASGGDPFSQARAAKSFRAIAEGMRPALGASAILHVGDAELVPHKTVSHLYATTVDVTFDGARPALADLMEHTRGYLFTAGSCVYAVSFTGPGVHADQIDAESRDAIATLVATPPTTSTHAIEYYAGMIMGLAIVVGLGWALLAHSRKTPSLPE